ncbi:MAG: HEAT repeat domain-containing protein [Myxococcota bacterium]|jgi:HEAT repeat protein|nr:HEAT repeat domain-containing protein [Myxococcota bacterium]
MGLWDLFDKEKRKERALEKAIARITNPYMQGPERMKAVDTLLEIGTDDAIYGLLKRFTIRASNGVVDEEEKEQVYAVVIGLGTQAVPALRRFIQKDDQIYHALRALSAILPEEQVITSVGETLELLGTDYMRNPERKLHLIQHLAELRGPRVVALLLPFLRDHDEGVRFQTVNALHEQADEVAREPLLELLCSPDEESVRLRKRIVEVLAERGWGVQGYRKKVEERLPKGYAIDKAGLIKERGTKIEPAATEADDDD